MKGYWSSSGEPPLNPCPIESSSPSSSLLFPSTPAEETSPRASTTISNVALGSGTQRLVKIYSYVYLLVTFYRAILGFLYDRRVNASESLLSTSDDPWGIHRFENLNVSVTAPHDTPQHSKNSFPPSPSHLTLLFTATHAQVSCKE
ncbi:hypothetical protein CPB86DRAFT_280903 [Serendipita vermifera]|nr:hypothetical protein CPB86DRAFT_280903 [Serendipita vermifera]